jgi:NADH:ubiquinone reductase (H+-translocating)
MKVVIVGAGFGGLRLARKLNNKAGFEVLLVDRFNYHQFQPLFYQVATAGLDASNISFPLRKVFQHSKNVRIRLANLKEVVPSANKIITDIEEISYDVLVLATGRQFPISQSCLPDEINGGSFADPSPLIAIV